MGDSCQKYLDYKSRLSLGSDGTGFVTVVAAPTDPAHSIHLRTLRVQKQAVATAGTRCKFRWSTDTGNTKLFGDSVLTDGFTLPQLQYDFAPDSLRGPAGAALQVQMVDAAATDVVVEAFFHYGPPNA